MIDLRKIIGFEWDQGNIDKSYQKHGITTKDAEEVFLDKGIQIKRDFKHHETEERFIAIGKNLKSKILFVIFTMRYSKISRAFLRIRIISARTANKKERRMYEEKTKTNTKI